MVRDIGPHGNITGLDLLGRQVAGDPVQSEGSYPLVKSLSENLPQVAHGSAHGARPPVCPPPLVGRLAVDVHYYVTRSRVDEEKQCPKLCPAHSLLAWQRAPGCS